MLWVAIQSLVVKVESQMHKPLENWIPDREKRMGPVTVILVDKCKAINDYKEKGAEIKQVFVHHRSNLTTWGWCSKKSAQYEIRCRGAIPRIWKGVIQAFRRHEAEIAKMRHQATLRKAYKIPVRLMPLRPVSYCILVKLFNHSNQTRQR